MSKEERTYFENELLARLKSLEWPGLTLTTVKKGLKFRLGKELVAQLDFQYLVKAQAYTLLGRVFGGPIFECCSKIVPPYRSNLGSDACFSFTTSGRQDKRFSTNVYGTISAPEIEEVGAVCSHIRAALENYYIPLVAGCILPSQRTIEDVLASPTDYAYPALFIRCAVAFKPEIISKEKLKEVMSNKKIVKNKDFDLSLLSVLEDLAVG
jgi:hypothetical protein